MPAMCLHQFQVQFQQGLVPLLADIVLLNADVRQELLQLSVEPLPLLHPRHHSGGGTGPFDLQA